MSPCVLRSVAGAVTMACVLLTSVGGAEPPGRTVDSAKELVITDPSVIGSAIETTFDPSRPSGTSKPGAWTFGRLVHNMLPVAERDSAAAASRLVLAWLRTWESDQTPNPGVTPARARRSIRLLVTDPWKAESGCVDPASPLTDDTCVLDFRKAPFRLIAVVNRPDLRIISSDGSAIAGEGRFVFQVVGPTLGVETQSTRVEVMDASSTPQKFTVIFEYALPVTRPAETLLWAQRWHALGALPFGAAFNATLRGITADFSGPDKDVRRPHGNALNQIRTNEVALMGARVPAAGFSRANQFWELREFRLTEAGLTPHTVNLEPARDFDVSRALDRDNEGTRTNELEAFLITNADAVLAAQHQLPETLRGNSALVGSAPYGAWGKLVNPSPPAVPAQGMPHNLAGVSMPVRDAFAINTCAGCHRHETDTRHFMHITTVGAMEPDNPLLNIDDRARVGVTAATPDTAIVLSNALAAEVGPGGARWMDYTTLLTTLPRDLRNKPGIRVCAR